MCSKLVLILTLCAIVNLSVGAVIREKSHKKEDFSEYFEALAAYRHRLQIEGLYPKIKSDSPTINAQNFDELEVIRLIPVTIKQLRQHKLSNEELIALRKIFGGLWDLIEEDAHRKRNEPRNDLLTDLLSSREIRFGKQDIREHLKNDIKGNSVQMVYNPETTGAIKFSDDPSTEPSQRILRMVAAICQQVYKERPAQKTRNKRSDSIDLENVRVTIQMPRMKRSLYPTRALIKKRPGLTKEEQRRIDEANEAAIMAAILAKYGNNGLDSSHGDDDEYDEEDEDDDYYGDDDQDYLMEHTESSVAATESMGNTGKQEAALVQSDSSNEMEGRSPDYAYDESGAEDDYYLHEFKPRFNPGDFENASVNELIMLAMRHHARKQGHQGRKAYPFQTA